MLTGRTGRVAVIGANGFIGGHVVRALRQADREVTTFTRSVPFLSDGRLHPDLITAQTIFWLASSINPQLAVEYPERVVADRRMFEDFLDRLAQSAATSTVILLSSGGTVYDPASPPPYREDSPTKPLSSYGAAKLELEALLAARAPAAHLTVRLSNAYGPGQPAQSGQGVIAHWMRAVRSGDPITLIGDPESARDYIFVGDIADALVHVANADPLTLPAVINVGSGQATSLRELIDLFAKVVAPRTLEINARPARSFDVQRTWLCIDLAESVIDWRPRTGLADGLAATWRHLLGTSPS